MLTPIGMDAILILYYIYNIYTPTISLLISVQAKYNLINKKDLWFAGCYLPYISVLKIYVHPSIYVLQKTICTTTQLKYEINRMV